MNALWVPHDGVGAVDRVAALTSTRAPEDASPWRDVVTSPNDVAKLYRHIPGMPGGDLVTEALRAALATAADGFDQAFGLLAPGLAPGVDAYAEQGWTWYLPSDLYPHSAGVVADRYVVVVLSVQRGVDERTAKNRVAAVTSALVSGSHQSAEAVRLRTHQCPEVLFERSREHPVMGQHADLDVVRQPSVREVGATQQCHFTVRDHDLRVQ